MIDDLLSPSRIEPLDAQPGAADTAWDEVRRRRARRVLRTQVAVVAGLVAVVMVGVLPSLDEGGRAAELDVAGREKSRRVEISTPNVKAERGNPESAPGPQEPGRSATGSPPQTVSPAPPAGRPTRPADQAPTAGRVKPPVERRRYDSVTLGCIDWCVSAAARAEDGAHALSLDLCVQVGTRARRFSFATTQEVDFTVRDFSSPSETLWTWSAGQRFTPHDHHVDIPSGSCVSWTTLWDHTEENGRSLPPGTYRLSVRSLAEQLGDRSTAETTFQISE